MEGIREDPGFSSPFRGQLRQGKVSTNRPNGMRGRGTRYRLQWEKLRNNRLETRSFECNAIFPVNVRENIPKGDELRSKENQVRIQLVVELSIRHQYYYMKKQSVVAKLH